MDLRDTIAAFVGVVLLAFAPILGNLTLSGVGFAIGVAGFLSICYGLFCNKDKDAFRDWARQRNKQV